MNNRMISIHELKVIKTNMITLFINNRFKDLAIYTQALEADGGLNRHDWAGVKQAFNNYLARR